MGSMLIQNARYAMRYLRYMKHKGTLPENRLHDDIYLVEFPKSGVTWLQHLLGNIELQLAGRNERITYYNNHKYTPDIEQVKCANINRFLGRTFIKSHSRFNPFYFFVIYLLRNPFDVMTSYYNFTTGQGSYRGDFESFVKSGKYGVRAWKKHVSSWFDNRARAQRIHLVKYENLLEDAKREIKSIYQNLGVDLADEIVNEAIRRSELRPMQESEEHYRSFDPNHTIFFVGKKGKRGKEELMGPETIRYIQRVAKEELERFYPDLLL